MTRLRISLDAARIIALTAVIGFVDGSFRIEESISSSNSIALVTVIEQMAAKSASSNSKPESRSGSAAYLIEIRHGDTIREVLVDTVTGRVFLP